jgi:hypothetical protein
MSGSDDDNSSDRSSRRLRAAARELEELQDSVIETGFLQREQRRRQKNASTTTSSLYTDKLGKRGRRATRKETNNMSAAYNTEGIHINSGKDLCDCLDLDCLGCFFPCSKCGSTKCGSKCRSGRKWMYQQVVEQNPFEEAAVVRTRPV